TLNEFASDTNHYCPSANTCLLFGLIECLITVLYYALDIRYSPGLHITKSLMSTADTYYLGLTALYAGNQSFHILCTNIEANDISLIAFCRFLRRYCAFKVLYFIKHK